MHIYIYISIHLVFIRTEKAATEITSNVIITYSKRSKQRTGSNYETENFNM